MVAIHSVPEWDLYVVYEGTNPDTGQPIIKAFLNPLVGWIWFGLVIIVFGTFIALVPSLTPATAVVRVPAKAASITTRTEGGRLMVLRRSRAFAFWTRAAEASFLVVAICFSLGATTPSSRQKR